jgi:3-hydroxyacyl-[acyl-carrier-protein] dehydratase
MLLNDLFTYSELEESSVSLLKFKIEISVNHAVFDGHFPGNPVMPGVCQMEIVKEVMCSYFKKELVYNSVSDMKFINMWLPNEAKHVFLDISTDTIENGFKLKASIYSDTKTYFKLRGELNGSF